MGSRSERRTSIVLGGLPCTSFEREQVRRELKERGADTLIAIMAHNPDSLRFYRSVENATIHDEAVWMDL